MARKIRLVMIEVPNEKVAKLDKFLENKPVNVFRKSKSEISKISKGRTKRYESNHYEVLVCGNNKVIDEFIHSLFKNNLIPEGKQWTVYVLPNSYLKRSHTHWLNRQ